MRLHTLGYATANPTYAKLLIHVSLDHNAAYVRIAELYHGYDEGLGERFDALYQWLGYESYSKARESVKPIERSTEQLSAMVQAIDIAALDRNCK